MQLSRSLAPFARRLTGRHARMLDLETQRTCERSRTRMIRLDAVNDLDSRAYARWGGRIGDEILADLRNPTP